MTFITKKVFIHAKYVCERAKTDAEKVARYFEKNGYKIVYNPKKADIIIFNSCGYSNPVANRCLEEIQKLKKYSGELIVIGGLPKTDRKRFFSLFTGIALSHNDLNKFDELFPHHPFKFKDLDDCHTSWITLDESSLSGVFKKFIIQKSYTKCIYSKISDFYFKHTIGDHYMILSNPLDIPTDSIFRIEIARGCSFHCSYCAIRKSIGPFNSKPFDLCVSEFKKGLDRGFTTFYITAPDPGGYGLDIGTSYPTLLKKLIKFGCQYEIVLEGLNPIWLVKYIDELEKLVREEIIQAISIPIQSGCPRILRLMNRFSEIEKIKNAIQRLKTSYPKSIISTNCIIGFPSETEEEFTETLNFLKETYFNMGFCNPVSIRPNTSAEILEPKISKETIKKRISFTRNFLKQQGYKTYYTKTGGVVFGKNKKL